MSDNPPSNEPNQTRAASASSLSVSPGPAILVIFGVTGDLSKRYLMPALYRLFRDNLLDDKTQIIGVSRRTIDLEDLFDKVEMCVSEADNICDPVVMARMHSRTRVHQLDMDSTDAFKSLRTLLDDIEAEQGVCMDRLYYLSIPPTAYNSVIGHMGEAGLQEACKHDSGQARLLVEKPFGSDLASAETLVKETADVFSEEQIFRIDHYLAKETAQNILAFRFQNPIFEPIWNNQHVNHIDIIAAEQIGIEGRIEFYEHQGALRDFIQNHLLQLLAITTMDRPDHLDSQSIHEHKLALLQSVRPIERGQVANQTLRGQYEGYREEVDNAGSNVETFASITTSIDNDRWRNVPITITTGKALDVKSTTITMTFKEQWTNFANSLRFRMQPNEGIGIDLQVKKPGFEQELQTVTMDFAYEQNFESLKQQPSAYERVILDAIRGDRTLFASSDEVLASWRVIDAVVSAWAHDDEGLVMYPQGSSMQAVFDKAKSAS